MGRFAFLFHNNYNLKNGKNQEIFEKFLGEKIMEISFFNNIKKYNSKSDKSNITNVINEAFRESEEFKNSVNEKLSSENRVLVRDFSLLERQYEDTEVRSTTKDIVTVVSSVQAGDFEAETMQDLTYLLSKEDWKEYYQKNLKFLKEKLGKNAHCVYAVIHLDESTPHLHSCWTFSEENKHENNEINYAKIDKALRNNFSNKNKRELNLKAGTKEYKEALEKYKQENIQKQVEKQLKKMQSKVSEKAFKCETGTSVINREFYRTINQEFVDKMKNEELIQKLQKKIEVFSSENCGIVKQRSEKYNNFESLDRAKHSMKAENEFLADKINKNNYTETELQRFKMINAKRILTEEKKAISQHDFNKKFVETEVKYRSIKNNKIIAKTLNVFNIKKLYEDIIKKNDKKKNLIKHFREELKIFENAVKNNVNLQEIEEIIDKSRLGESAKILISEKEKLKTEIKNAEYELKNLNKKIMEQSRYDDKLNGQIYKKQLELGEYSRLVNEKKEEAEKTYVPSRERIREIEEKAIKKAEEKAKIEIEKKNAELKELQKNIEQQRQVQRINEISIAEHKKKIAEMKEESAEIEKQIAEKRSLKIEELAEKSLKNAPVTIFEVDNYIEKNQEKYKDLIEKRQEKIENEIVAEMKEDTKQAFAVFQEFMRQYAKKFVYKDLVDFKEMKRLTIQAFAEIKTTSENFFADFIENLRSKVNDLIAMRQNSNREAYTTETRTRQGKTR